MDKTKGEPPQKKRPKRTNERIEPGADAVPSGSTSAPPPKKANTSKVEQAPSRMKEEKRKAKESNIEEDGERFETTELTNAQRFLREGHLSGTATKDAGSGASKDIECAARMMHIMFKARTIPSGDALNAFKGAIDIEFKIQSEKFPSRPLAAAAFSVLYKYCQTSSDYQRYLCTERRFVCVQCQEMHKNQDDFDVRTITVTRFKSDMSFNQRLYAAMSLPPNCKACQANRSTSMTLVSPGFREYVLLSAKNDVVIEEAAEVSITLDGEAVQWRLLAAVMRNVSENVLENWMLHYETAEWEKMVDEDNGDAAPFPSPATHEGVLLLYRRNGSLPKKDTKVAAPTSSVAPNNNAFPPATKVATPATKVVVPTTGTAQDKKVLTPKATKDAMLDKKVVTPAKGAATKKVTSPTQEAVAVNKRPLPSNSTAPTKAAPASNDTASRRKEEAPTKGEKTASRPKIATASLPTIETAPALPSPSGSFLTPAASPPASPGPPSPPNYDTYSPHLPSSNARSSIFDAVLRLVEHLVHVELPVDPKIDKNDRIKLIASIANSKKKVENGYSKLCKFYKYRFASHVWRLMFGMLPSTEQAFFIRNVKFPCNTCQSEYRPVSHITNVSVFNSHVRKSEMGHESMETLIRAGCGRMSACESCMEKKIDVPVTYMHRRSKAEQFIAVYVGHVEPCNVQECEEIFLPVDRRERAFVLLGFVSTVIKDGTHEAWMRSKTNPTGWIVDKGSEAHRDLPNEKKHKPLLLFYKLRG